MMQSMVVILILFLSTLSLRRATAPNRHPCHCNRNFYPRSPCGERRRFRTVNNAEINISIHALLAESDTSSTVIVILRKNFYPRSPCGERPFPDGFVCLRLLISIHALLAESDTHPITILVRVVISIHALLAESDNTSIAGRITSNDFYPRSPCGERRLLMCLLLSGQLFLSTLSLRRATGTGHTGQ